VLQELLVVEMSHGVWREAHLHVDAPWQGECSRTRLHATRVDLVALLP
jgi:hypothetical protein